MSSLQSNLSSTGIDYVVAVSQDSINATLEQYLYGRLPEAILCYVYDDQNNPTPIDYAVLVANAHNTDPFAVPNGTPARDPMVQNLNGANFAFAIKAKLGLPAGVEPDSLPPIIGLKPGQSNVNYTLMFSEFVATELVFGPRGSVTWFNQAQPPGTPWTFTGAVDLNFQDASFERLSPAAQAKLKDLGNDETFSIQQLYYDLNSSDLEQGFQFNNLPSNSALNAFMTSDFVNTYWKALGGASVLGYAANQTSATSDSTLAVTDLNFFTPDAVGVEAAPLTLNYLCATNNDSLPDTTHAGFGWNWLEPDETQYDGVAALNRNTLAKYFDGKLRQYAETNCYSPAGHVRVWLTGTFHDVVNYQWGLTGNQTPVISFPTSGPDVLTYAYESGEFSDESGLNGDMGKLKMSSSFSLSMSFQGTTIVIVQSLNVYFYVESLSSGAGANIIAKQITDTYAIGFDEGGLLVATLQSSVPVDNSKTPSVSGFLDFFVDINTLCENAAQWAQNFVATAFRDIPVSAVQSFVFPAGRTFTFANASFSDNQDLVAHITYSDAS